MLPIIELMDSIGYHSLEVWGGATFDTCMRFLDEDPWDRLRRLRAGLPKTKLQMLLRGQNIVGYKHYPDDVLIEFVKKAVANGIDIIRIFDALNDLRNMEQAIKTTSTEGAHAQGTLSYTVSPLHDNDYFVKLALSLKDIGAHSICIKDMAGLISPSNAGELVRRLKVEVGLPVQLHCHYTSGMASMSYLKAVEAGVDVIDTANAALAMGASQPATDSMVAALEGTPYDTGLDLQLLSQVSEHFRSVSCGYEIPRAVMGVDTNVLSYQIPGGMISNLASQLADQKASHLLDQVLAEVPRVRADLGYPPLVTPSSQIVGAQAVVNVMAKERYKIVINEVASYLRGNYGKPPGPVNQDLQQQVLGREKPIDVRPADLLEPRLSQAREEITEYLEQEEDVLSYVIFPNVAIDFFKRRRGLLPPLELKSTCVSGQAVNEVKSDTGNKNEADLSGMATLYDEELVRSEGLFNVYPVG